MAIKGLGAFKRERVVLLADNYMHRVGIVRLYELAYFEDRVYLLI